MVVEAVVGPEEDPALPVDRGGATVARVVAVAVGGGAGFVAVVVDDDGVRGVVQGRGRLLCT